MSERANKYWVPVDGRNLAWLRSYAVAQPPRGYVCWGIRNPEDLYLIIAAPDLLEACKLALPYVPDYTSTHPDIMQAIAKAEGRDE